MSIWLYMHKDHVQQASGRQKGGAVQVSGTHLQAEQHLEAPALSRHDEQVGQEQQVGKSGANENKKGRRSKEKDFLGWRWRRGWRRRWRWTVRV